MTFARLSRSLLRFDASGSHSTRLDEMQLQQRAVKERVKPYHSKTTLRGVERGTRSRTGGEFSRDCVREERAILKERIAALESASEVKRASTWKKKK